MNRSPRKIFLFALPRSGSTMLCDRLTVPGRSVILHEPMILRRYGDGRDKRILQTLSRLGHDVDSVPGVSAGTIAPEWFDNEIVPRLQNYDFWGIKEVYLTDALELIRRYQPDQLLLLWRDPRDVALSMLELMNRALMSYSDRRTLKDEAWAMECLTDGAEQLGAIAKTYSHRLLRYEQLIGSETERQDLLAEVGLSEYGRQDIAMFADSHQFRTAEVERHRETWSNTSIDRWRREPAGWRRTFSEICFSRMQPFASAAGYPGNRDLADQVCAKSHATGRVRVSDPDYEPRPGFDFAYAKRRGRRVVADRLQPADVVLDVGGTTAALAFMTSAKVTVVDDGAPGKMVLSRQWRQGVFPNLDEFTVCTMIGSLEYTKTPLRMVSSLLDRNLRIHLTYHCKEDVPQALRQRLGFTSHLTRQDWQRFAASRTENWTADWVFDGYQSLITINPQGGPP